MCGVSIFFTIFGSTCYGNINKHRRGVWDSWCSKIPVSKKYNNILSGCIFVCVCVFGILKILWIDKFGQFFATKKKRRMFIRVGVSLYIILTRSVGREELRKSFKLYKWEGGAELMHGAIHLFSLRVWVDVSLEL